MEPADDPVAEAAKLPLADRVAHRNWKVREAAYRELTDKFNVAEEDAKIYADFFPTLGKIVRDANAPAQLAGFDVISKYADTAPPQLVRRLAADVTKGIVDKGLSGRPVNKAKAVEAFLMLVGADAGDLVTEAMSAHGFKHRTPKVVAAAVDSLTQAVDTYGTSAVPVKPITTKLPPLFGHSQEIVRNAAKALVIELHRWVGDPVKVVVKGAKEVTIKEVEAAFAKHVGQGKPQPKKLTRSMEQRKRERGGGAEEGDSDDGFGEGGQEEEELDLAEEINLIEKLGKVKIEIEEGVTKDWYTAVDSKKWSARKQALDAAVDIIGEARLTPANHQEVIVRIRKILAKDSNVNVVASAAKLVRAMCGGLKKHFPQGAAKALTVDLFGRLKEKNRVVLDAVSGALDALHLKKCIRIVDLLEEISTAAKHKVPKARCELLSWLGRSVREGTAGADLKGLPLKSFGGLFVTATDDSAPEVRDAGLSGLASLQKIVGERNVAAYLEKLDKKRKEKVAAIVAELPEPRKVAAGKPKPASAPKSAPPPKGNGKPAKRLPASKGPDQPQKASSPSKRPKPKKPAIEESDDEGEIPHTPEDAFGIAEGRFKSFKREQWSAKSFKARVAVVSLVVDGLRDNEVFTFEDVSLVLGLLACEPGLSDTNFMALKPKLELFGMVASKCAKPPPRKSLRPLLRNSVEKLGDIKSAKMASEIMISYAEATSPRYFFEILAEAIEETNNGRAVIGMLKFAGTLIEDFGVPSVPDKLAAKVAVATIGNAAPAARTAALALACKTSIRLQPGCFRNLMESLNASEDVLELFDAELKKYGREPDPPSRKKRFGVAAPTGSSIQGESTAADPVEQEGQATREESIAENDDTGTVVHEVKPLESTPAETKVDTPRERVSIAEHFAPGARIFLELKNSNWKKRQGALAVINKILEDAGDFITPDVGTDMVAALRLRLSDSNRNLATAAYEVLGRLVRAMGAEGAMHLKPFAPTVLGHGCIDIKKAVREAAMKVLWSWYDALGLTPLIQYCNLPLASLNSGFRKEFLEWLVPRLQGEVGAFDARREDLHPLVDPILACLRDRTAEVRHLADQALEQVILSVGIGTLDSKLATMTKSARHQIEIVLEKHRAVPQGAVSQESAPIRQSGIPTPRSGRDRPRSMAIPRTPMGRKGPSLGDDLGTPAGSSARRPRPASARMSPAVPSLGAFGGSTPVPPADSNLFLRNHGRDIRARRFLNNRRQFMEELTQVDPSGEMQPMISEDIEDIAADLTECCSAALCTKLTAPANRFRMHVEAIESMSSYLEDHPETILFAADVLLRWSACRIEDSRTPPTVLAKLASFVSNICEILLSSGSKIGEYEAAAILPPVVEKCGSNRDTIRQTMRSTLLSIGDVVEDEVLLVLLTSCLRYPISPNAHEEVASEICRLLDKRCVAGAGMPPGVLSTIGRVAGGEDEGAGRAAAVCLDRAHEYFGDDLWNLVGDLSDQQAAQLDDRLKGVSGRIREESSAARGAASDVSVPSVHAEPNAASQSMTASTPVFPSDIRNEDFRLSVAPAPPSSVMTSISESLSTATPVKTRVEGRYEGIPQTPGLPLRERVSEGNNGDDDVASDILLRLQSDDRDLQLSGLASLFDDLKSDATLLRNMSGAQLLLQLVRCFSNTLHRLESNSAEEDDPAVLKSFLKGVIRFAREPQLLRRLDQMAVERLLGDALNAMIPQSVDGVDDWDQVRRGVNLMIVKVLESCDQNLLYTAMINLLLQNLKAMQHIESVETSSALAKSSICIKSIAKVTKRGFGDCRVNALLRDIHLFLMANPVRRDGTSSSEDQTFAMRLLKTVVNSIIDEIGSDICLHLDLIPQPEKSQLVQYIDMTLIDLRRANGDSQSEMAVEQIRRREADASVESCLSKIDRGVDRESSLRHLRSVLGWCPEVDLSLHLEKYSASTKSYVTEGLKRPRRPSLGGTAEEEAEVRKLESQVSFLGTNDMRKVVASPLRQAQVPAAELAIDAKPPTGALHSAGQVYLKRLHEIQLRYGLQTGSRGGTEVAAGRAVVEKENGAMEKLATNEEARGKALSLRERMARIRELQSASKE